jgi:hypothetical protein
LIPFGGRSRAAFLILFDPPRFGVANAMRVLDGLALY